MRTFLGRVKKTPTALAAALLASAIGCASHNNITARDVISETGLVELNKHAKQMEELVPVQQLRDNNSAVLSVNDFRKAIYGQELAREVAKAAEYRQRHADYGFVTDYSEDNLNRRAEKSKELTYTLCFNDQTTAPFVYMSLAETNGTLQDKTTQTTDPHRNKSLVSDQDIEAWGTSFKRLAFSLGQPINSPEDSVWALKQLGFDVDTKLVEEIATERGTPLDPKAFDTPVVSLEAQREIYNRYRSLKRLMLILTGGPLKTVPMEVDIDGNPVRTRFDQNEPTPLRISNPKVYKKILDGLIFRTPGLVQASPTAEPAFGIA